MRVVECDETLLPQAASLFDAYRGFYGRDSDLSACRAFLESNLRHGRSKIFLLLDGERAVAFAQLYPSYCSLELRPFHYLSDLFVDPPARGKGRGRLLMEELIRRFRTLDVQRLTLETARDNVAAQRLYESLGYERDAVFVTYHRPL